jgi:hypothetical protein
MNVFFLKRKHVYISLMKLPYLGQMCHFMIHGDIDFSPWISGTATNPIISGSTSITLRPSSAGTLTSQSLAARMAAASRDYLVMESMAKNQRYPVESIPHQIDGPAVKVLL